MTEKVSTPHSLWLLLSFYALHAQLHKLMRSCAHAHLQFLLVQWEISRLDAELAVARVAEHVFKFSVPGNTVGVLLLCSTAHSMVLIPNAE